MANTARRAEICKTHGLKDEAEAYRLVADGVKTGVQKLLGKRLAAPVLRELGYSLEGMRKLGYNHESLAALGYLDSAQELAMTEPSDSEKLRQLLKEGWRADRFRQHGHTLHHLKRAGCMIVDLQSAGFQLDDLVSVYSAAELKRSGFSIRELKRYFRGPELKNAGFDATDMRNAGYGIRELMNFGFNENQVRIAGFSINELAREGLSRQTVDRTRRS
ncbi:MAG: hypothetical protein ACR2IE_13160 [Candidatus Sumerlaeaceae bacterium]